MVIDNEQEPVPDDKTAQLKTNLAELQQLAEAYMKTLSTLPELAEQYYKLHRHIRIRMRRLQLVKNGKLHVNSRQS
jgi:hypothetical protein